MQVQTHGREGKGGGDGGTVARCSVDLPPIFASMNLLRVSVISTLFLFIVNLENLTLATHI